MEAPMREMPAPPSYKLVRFPGFETNIREVTTSPRDVASMNRINRAVSASEFSETNPAETPEETKAWLSAGTTRKLDSDLLGKKRAVLGVSDTRTAATDEMVVAVVKPGKSELDAEITEYTYIYNHDSPVVQKNPDGPLQKEISYVTPDSDPDRSVDDMSQALGQSALLLWSQAAGIKLDDLTGVMSKSQKEAATKALEIYSTSGDGADETKYRQGLENAGFTKVGEYDEDGANQIVWKLTLEEALARQAHLLELTKRASK